MQVAKRFCQKTGRRGARGDANPPDGRDKKCWPDEAARKGLLAIQSGDRVRWGGIDRLNMTAGNLLWSQLSAGSQQPNQTRSKWRFEKSGFSTPSSCLVIHPRNGSNFSPCPIVHSFKSVGGNLGEKRRRHTHARWIVGELPAYPARSTDRRQWEIDAGTPDLCLTAAAAAARVKI